MTKVGKWMTRNPITIGPETTIIEAMHLMKEKRIRRVPVVYGDQILGILTDRLVAEFGPSKATSLDTWEVHYILSTATVTEAMKPNPYKVTVDTDLTEAAQLLHDRKLNGVLVVDSSDRLIGIFTTTNALEALIAICRDPRICSGE